MPGIGLLPTAPLKRLLLLLLSALAMLALPGIAGAAQSPPVRPVALTGVKLISETPTESRFALIFAPRAVSYAVAAGAPNQPGIGFALASRSASAAQPPGLKGLVRSISFDQRDVILIVRFNATTSATVSAAQTDARTVEVTVRSALASRAELEAPPTASGASLPPPNELPEGYELVLLKYADVSEVVGLLTDGQTIKSNDVFIPAEPAFGSTSLTGNNYTPQQVTQAPGANDDPLGQSVDASIAIDRRLNAVLLKGSPDRIAALKAMIAAVDIPVDSVILETQMVELTESGQKALGIDFANSSGQIGVVNVTSGVLTPIGIGQGCSGDPQVCSGHVTSAAIQAALYAHRRAERLDRQDHHRRRASDPDLDRSVGSQRRLTAGPICECRRHPADRAAGQRRRVRLEPCVRGGVERHRLQPGLSDDQPA
jgi:general secretion pathway protein D